MIREGLRPLRVFVDAGRNFARDGCFDRAATVGFYSLLSLGPLLYLIGLGLRAVIGDPDATANALRNLSWFFPEAAAAGLERALPSLRLDQRLALLALPALFWVATFAIASLEYAINVAFQMAPRRRAWLGHLKATVVLLIVSVAMSASLLSTQLPSRLSRYRERLGLPPPEADTAELLSYAGLIAVSFASFTLIFKSLPQCRTYWRPSALAGLVSMVLWEMARQVFGGLLVHSPTFGLLTGGLAAIVAFLLWIYTTVAIILYGAEFAALLGQRRNAEPD